MTPVNSNMQSVEFLILGSGFGGSLLAMILARCGHSVALIDRAVHPRFAIGESSTPLADAALARLADRYQLPQLLPLTQYGPWKRTFPELLCGRKRGFTYLRQLPGSDLNTDNFTGRRLLAAASASNEQSDTQWLRSDVDHFFFQQAVTGGALCFEGCQYQLSRQPFGWMLDGQAAGRPVRLQAGFAIDATGSAGGLLKLLNIPSRAECLKTNSRALFAHFANTATCEQMLQESGISTSEFPFACDDAAVHQVLDEGWMWQLRFDDDTLSAGLVIGRRNGAGGSAVQLSAASEWKECLDRYPFLKRQFAGARIVRFPRGLKSTGRLQRLTTCAAGADWAALPNTAGFIDALHSTGIAQTLSGVECLAAILTSPPSAPFTSRTQQLQSYSRQVIDEICLIDELVEGCYAALPSFELWCDWTILYLAAVTTTENNVMGAESAGDCGAIDPGAGFLRVRDPAFRCLLREARQLLPAGTADDGSTPQQTARFRDWLRRAIKPWNQAGLLDERCGGLYASTAAPPKPSIGGSDASGSQY